MGFARRGGGPGGGMGWVSGVRAEDSGRAVAWVVPLSCCCCCWGGGPGGGVMPFWIWVWGGGAMRGGRPGEEGEPWPVTFLAWRTARWCLDMAIASWSFVSISVKRVSSSGGGLSEAM